MSRQRDRTQPTRPARPDRQRLEPDLESQLELALLVAGGAREPVRVAGNRRQPDCRPRRSSPTELKPDICSVLKTFFISAMTSARTDPRSGIHARVAHVDVVAVRQVDRVAADKQRPIAGDAVAVQIEVRRGC